MHEVRVRLWLAACLGVALAGCMPRPVVYDRPVSPEVAAPAKGVPPAVESPAAPSSRGPGETLRREAAAAAATGAYPQAGQLLERALRVEPGNGLVWYDLGVIRYRQEQYQQSIQLWLKAVSLAGTDTALQRSCWQRIEQAWQALGSGAEAAEARRNWQRLL